MTKSSIGKMNYIMKTVITYIKCSPVKVFFIIVDYTVLFLNAF